MTKVGQQVADNLLICFLDLLVFFEHGSTPFSGTNTPACRVHGVTACFGGFARPMTSLSFSVISRTPVSVVASIKFIGLYSICLSQPLVSM